MFDYKGSRSGPSDQDVRRWRTLAQQSKMYPNEGVGVIVADVMTESVRTLSPNTPLRDAAREMIDAGISGMPVVDAEGQLVGILTEADFINPRGKGHRTRRLLHALFGNGDDALAEAEVTAELMTTDVVTTEPAESVRNAARLMAKESVKRLPVTDSQGRLVGIVSRADLLQTFARPDEEITADIRQTTTSIPLPIDLDGLMISVDDGFVTLEGKVETSGDAAVLTHVVERLEGVTGVESRLTWDVDLGRPEQKWPGFDQEGAPTQQ